MNKFKKGHLPLWQFVSYEVNIYIRRLKYLSLMLYVWPETVNTGEIKIWPDLWFKSWDRNITYMEKHNSLILSAPSDRHLDETAIYLYQLVAFNLCAILCFLFLLMKLVQRCYGKNDKARKFHKLDMHRLISRSTHRSYILLFNLKLTLKIPNYTHNIKSKILYTYMETTCIYM